MNFEKLVDIEKAGFEGFLSIADLKQRGDLTVIPNEPGIYLVLRTTDTDPQFLAVNPSRMHHRHREQPEKHSYAPVRLQGKWEAVKSSVVIYIGKAGGQKHKTTLRRRLRAYLRAGLSTPGSSSHSGGRAIWQLKDAEDLIICWKATPGIEAVEEEQRLIDTFKARYGTFPLANWRR